MEDYARFRVHSPNAPSPSSMEAKTMLTADDTMTAEI
jgi:hypothetical protein